MRAIVTTAQGTPVKELLPDRVLKLDAVHEVNGEHSLTLQTLDFLEKLQRVLVEDPNTENWHEYVVLGIDEEHEDAGLFINTYYCVESWQYELAGTVLKSQPGKNSPVNATAALTAALAGSRWSVGTVEPTTRSGASFYYLSGYEALSLVVQNWGGEVEASVTVSGLQVDTREINLLNHIGSSEIVDIFEYARNVSGIKRLSEDAPYTCRIIPRGAALESDSGGYGRKIGIASVNPTGKEYLENSETAELLKLANGGSYIYPTQVVEYADISDPQLLYDTALADLPKYTTPQISYEVSVLNIAGWQLENGGRGALELGDAVRIVDNEYPDGLVLDGRVVRLNANYLDTRYNVAVIGFDIDGLPGEFAKIQNQIGSLGNWRDLVAGALAASDTGKLTTTSDLTVGGNILTIGNSSNTDYDALQFKTQNYTSLGIRAYDNGSTYGHNVLIQSGGLLIMGGGEYAANRYALSDLQGQDIEATYLGSDNAVNIEAGGNTIANRRTWSFTGNGQILHNIAEIDLTTTPSSKQARNVTVWNDVNGDPIGQLAFEHTTAGYVGAGFGSRWGTVYNQLILRTDASGNRSVYVDAPAEWREALGYATSSTAPTITAQTNFTVSGISARKRWGMVQLMFQVVTTNALTANTNYTVGNIATAFRPALEADLIPRGAGAASNSLFRGYIQTGGNIVLRPNQAVPAGTTLYAWTIYLAASF